MGFPEEISTKYIPVDKNAKHVSVMASYTDGEIVPVAATELPDGTSAIKTTVANAASFAYLLDTVEVTDAAAVLILAANTIRVAHTLRNTGADTVYLGVDDTVTDANGIPLAAGATITLDPSNFAYVGAVYGICSTGDSSEIRGIEFTSEEIPEPEPEPEE